MLKINAYRAVSVYFQKFLKFDVDVVPLDAIPTSQFIILYSR
jgi:hypothetical protein